MGKEAVFILIDVKHVMWVFHASSISVFAVRDVKKKTEYRDVQYSSISVGR